MTEREEITTILFEDYGYIFPSNLAEFISELQKILDMAPNEYRDAVEIDIDADTQPVIEISYDRSETDLEMSARAQTAEGRRTEQERSERAKLAELKRKHPND